MLETSARHDEGRPEPAGMIGVAEEPPGREGMPAWLAVLVALLMFLSGVGVGWLVLSPSERFTVDPSAPSVTPDDETGASPPSDVAPPTAPPMDGPQTDEPVADVAEALLPSVVQIVLPMGGVGSGVIYTPDGLILTAAHVVQGVSQVTVRLPSGDRVPGTVVGADPGNDIAVVDIARDDLPAAPLALDEEPRVGQTAIALGSPWGLESTVTAGVVSAVNQTIRDPNGWVNSMLQTDAPINPGNSGGPLADRHGRVIGINVSIFSTTGANGGVGFAVPIDRAHRVAQALVEGGDFTPGYLGVGVEGSTDGRAGAVIANVEPGSAAAAAGLRQGDVVVEVDGVPVADPGDLGAQIRSREAGDEVTLVIERDGEERPIRVTLGSR